MPQSRSDETFDVVIVGGGLVGASLAVALGSGGKRIALIESATFAESQPAPRQGSGQAWDERTLALNLASQRIFEALGLWGTMRAEAEPILATHISERGGFGVARFSAAEAGEEALGWNVPVRALGAALWRRLAEAKNVNVLCPAKISGIEVAGEVARVTVMPAQAGIQESRALRPHPTLPLKEGEGDTRLRGNDETQECLPSPVSRLTAKLVVAADGAQSAVRKLLGIGASLRDYGQTAIVGAVRPQRPHRGVAYERFTPDGPVALLPKPNERCALVWTVPTARAHTILSWTDAQFLEGLQDAFGHRLGGLLEAGCRQGFPLTRVLSERITAPRVIFAGNAAQTLHPVAAQGFNLGLRDVATVAELAQAAEDPGAPEVLAEYEARRMQDRERVSGFTDRLVRIFSNDIPGLRGARHLGLLALDLLPPLKQAVMRQNLGYAGAAPLLARNIVPSPLLKGRG